MCDTCGCGNPDQFRIHDRNAADGETHSHEHFHDGHSHTHSHSHGHGHEMHHHDHLHGHEHNHNHHHHHDVEVHSHDGHHHEHHHEHHHHHGEEEHPHEHSHDGHSHEHGHEHGHAAHHHDEGHGVEIPLNIDILSENNRLAERNRGYFEAMNALVLNLVSSPGSGKTTILEKTIRELVPAHKVFVIEGDQQTTRDAERIEKSGAPAIQINTGSGCHLDARMVNQAVKKLEIQNNGILFIENVGNLVCPAMFDLGEQKRVVVISVTEGDDKPLKYPYMFQSSHLCIINKTDLLPYVDFSVETAIQNARQLNPALEFILMSARTGEGMQEWLEKLKGWQR